MTFLVLSAIAAGLIVAFRIGVARGRKALRAGAPLEPGPIHTPRLPPNPASPTKPLPPAERLPARGEVVSEPVSVIATLRAEVAALRSNATTVAAEHLQLAAFAEDRRLLQRELATARADTARFRALVVDVENNTPPPLLTGPNTPDDLKLIVGIGPVLERMLFQLGISTYRQLARMNDRDIDELDSRLPEFPGRIRRDEWVTQARALYQYKYGAPDSARP